MPNSILLYDALRSLNIGHLLRKAGGMSNGSHLESCQTSRGVRSPATRRLSASVVFPDRNPDAIQFFALSEAGSEKLREVSDWYEQQPWYLKLWGRLGLPLPDS